MFPFQQGDDLYFQISSNPHQETSIKQDLILDFAPLDESNKTNMPNSRQRKSLVRGKDKNLIDTDNKKMMHRDIERQRRQERAALHESLRSLLPLELIKGKRSISDQLNEAVNYIKHLQKRVQELGGARDALLRPRGACSCLVVCPCLGGLEIMFSTGLGDQGLPLSSVLVLMLKEGLDVVSCVSTQVNQRMQLHTIRSEVCDPTCVDLSEMQQKLTAAISAL